MDANTEDSEKNPDQNPLFLCFYSYPFGQFTNILSRFFKLFCAFYRLFGRNAASQSVRLARSVICLHSTQLWKEKKMSKHICDASYAVQEQGNTLAHISLPVKSCHHR